MSARKKTSELLREASEALVAHGCDPCFASELRIRAGILEVFYVDAMTYPDTHPSRRVAMVAVEEGNLPGENPEATAAECPCGEGGNPLHVFVCPEPRK